MSYRYFPIEFSSYEDYVKYLKEKGFAIEVTIEVTKKITPIKNKVMTQENNYFLENRELLLKDLSARLPYMK